MSALLPLNDRTRSNSIQSFVSSIFSSNSTNFNESEEYLSNPSFLDNNNNNNNKNLYYNDNDNNINKNHSNDLDFLQYIDPKPSLPPNYNDININARSVISFPIWETHHTSIDPPEYSPAVYDYTIVSIRTEYDSPNEKLSQFKSKVWQNFILEINSTQINLYNIHPKLTKIIPNYSQGIIPNNILFSFQRRQAYQLDSHDQEMILDEIKINPKEYLNQKMLFDSFSLQFAKCGIPLDFLYRRFVQDLKGERSNEFNLQNVPNEKVIFNLIKIEDQKYLRARFEGRQFLLKFKDVETMLLWYTQLNIGVNVSLDLDLREFPNYRVVPRRRAHQYRDFHYTLMTNSVDDIDNNSDNLFNLSLIGEREDTENSDYDCSSSSSDSDECRDNIEKYKPEDCPYSHEKYLFDCIRCIKPLSEMKSWLNKVIVMPTNEPKFTTKNLPKYYHPIDTTNTDFKIQNHSVGLFLLNENNDLVELNHSTVASWNNLNSSRIV